MSNQTILNGREIEKRCVNRFEILSVPEEFYGITIVLLYWFFFFRLPFVDKFSTRNLVPIKVRLESFFVEFEVLFSVRRGGRY